MFSLTSVNPSKQRGSERKREEVRDILEETEKVTPCVIAVSNDKYSVSNENYSESNENYIRRCNFSGLILISQKAAIRSVLPLT